MTPNTVFIWVYGASKVRNLITGSIPVPASPRNNFDNDTITLPDGFSPVSPRRYVLVQIRFREPVLGSDLDKGDRLPPTQTAQSLRRDRKKFGGFLGR